MNPNNDTREEKPRCTECGNRLTFNDHRSVMMSVDSSQKCSRCSSGERSWNADELRGGMEDY